MKTRVKVVVIHSVSKVWFVVINIGVGNVVMFVWIVAAVCRRPEIFFHSVLIVGVANVLRGRPDIV